MSDAVKKPDIPMTLSAPSIDVHSLGVAFGRRRVLHEVSLKVHPGETLAVVGANGSGKSTLLRALVRLELADTGGGEVLGRSILDDDWQFNEKIGYVSEMLEFQVPVKLTRIVQLFTEMRPHFSREIFERIVKAFDLDLGRRAIEYSRGQKVQFAFALAMASRPQVILLDEVTAVLDLHVRDLVMREVRALTREGSCALIATNILTEVLPYADRLLILEAGRLAMDTPLADLDARYSKLSLAPGAAVPSDARLIKGSSGENLIYLVPRPAVPGALTHDPVTGEDVFLYHCRKGA